MKSETIDLKLKFVTEDILSEEFSRDESYLSESELLVNSTFRILEN